MQDFPHVCCSATRPTFPACLCFGDAMCMIYSMFALRRRDVQDFQQFRVSATRRTCTQIPECLRFGDATYRIFSIVAFRRDATYMIYEMFVLLCFALMHTYNTYTKYVHPFMHVFDYVKAKQSTSRGFGSPSVALFELKSVSVRRRIFKIQQSKTKQSKANYLHVYI